MGIKPKAYMLAVLTFGSMAGLGIAADLIDDRIAWFILLCPPVALVISLAILRCPTCGEYLGKEKKRILGAEFTIWGRRVIPKRCPRCGAQF
jgi:hypothetical protein